MSLATYRKKRDFGRTSEPRGRDTRQAGRTPRAGFSFVVQKHDARRLHYDFRLELDGVLKSWAIPKGPSMNPADKRLSVETEDHPLEYGEFEGVIPQGEYGGGAVVVWDRGEWIPKGDPQRAYEKGHLTFELVGSKLHGSFHLIRTRRAGKGHGKSQRATNWLLIKRDDAAAERTSHVVEEQPDSVQSGRTIEAVAAHPARVWHSKAQGHAKSSKPARPDAAVDASAYAGVRKAALPDFIEPQLATLVREAPAGDAWLHELKLDGYRMQVRLDHGHVRVLTRRGHDWSARIPSVAAELAQLPVERAIFDGELVVLRDGVSDFQRLQNSLSEGRDSECVLYLFDCMYLDGFDLRALALSARKSLLAACQSAYFAASNGRLRLSEHLVGQGPDMFARACELGAEGSVCKRADAPYLSGRHQAWLKVKCTARQEFVIGGYSEPKASRAHLGALLLGVMDRGELKYAGRVGTGFSERSLRDLKVKLAPLERAKPAYANPPHGADARDVHWVEPKLVAEVEYAQRTADGLVRHGAFRGLREDKPARQVQRETPAHELDPESTSAAHGGRRKHATPGRKGAKRDRDAAGQPAEPAVALPALRSVRLTHPNRALFPELHVTKAQLALYYAQVAERMLPHLAGRPLMLVRCPNGQGSPCFHQKHPTAGMSHAIKRHTMRERTGTFDAMVVDDAEGLVQLVQNGALEIHTWGSRIDAIECPDQLTFDLDPGQDVPWEQVVRAAQRIAQRLTALELPNFLKTTGGKGLHIVVPVAPRLAWDEIKAMCKSFAESFVRAEPAQYSATLSKAARKDKILIDYLRNGRGATAVCAYSTRAKPSAPVATPIAWSELSAQLRSDSFTIHDVPNRLAQGPDPWADFGAHRPKLTAALQRALSK